MFGWTNSVVYCTTLNPTSENFIRIKSSMWNSESGLSPLMPVSPGLFEPGKFKGLGQYQPGRVLQ